MSGVSNYFCDLLADAISHRVSIPTTAYIALCTEEPFSYSTGATIVEPPSGVGYSRQSYSLNTSNWSSASSGSIRSTQVITFTTAATGIWGTAVAWALCSASSGGNLLLWGTLDAGLYVNTGAAVSIPIGGIEIAVEPPSASVIG